MKYFFHPAAETEHLENLAYYESKHAGLGARYLGDFEKSIQRVSEKPYSFPAIENSFFRKKTLLRFHFQFYIVSKMTTFKF